MAALTKPSKKQKHRIVVEISFHDKITGKQAADFVQSAMKQTLSSDSCLAIKAVAKQFNKVVQGLGAAEQVASKKRALARKRARLAKQPPKMGADVAFLYKTK
jgi:hypothetical protein